MAEIKIIKSKAESCSNCRGDGEECDNGLSWVYCETRANNLELFEGDCGELLGCNLFKKAACCNNPELNKGMQYGFAIFIVRHS